MADNFTKVITYIADFTDIKNQLKQLGELEKKIAGILGAQMSESFNVQKILSEDITKITKNIQGLTTTQTARDVQLVDGRIGKLTETITVLGAKTKTAAFTFQEFGNTAASSLNALTGQSSQLATNFKQVANVQQMFAGHLKDFGNITKVSSQEMTKITDDTRQLSFIADTADGKFLKLTETTKELPGGIQEVSRSVQDVTAKYQTLNGQSSQLATNFSNISNVQRMFNKQLSGFGPIANVVNSKLVQVGDNSKKLVSVVQTTDGKFLKLTETINQLPGGIQKVSRSVQDVTAQQLNATKGSESLTASIGRLLKRAALTIPVWLVLRSAVTGFFSVIKDGIKAIEDESKAFEKARRNLEATAKSQEELTIQMGELKQKTLALSLQSGKSVEELTHTFQRFATVGFDAETSFAGMEYATKLATVEFGNARETADAFARSMRVLIDTSSGAVPQATQIAEAMALTDQLWQTNAFEIQEFTHNLTEFAGTAKAMNLSIKDTITLLATLSTGGLSTRAGRLLRTTILKAFQDLNKVSNALNLGINPAVDSTFNIIMKLIGGLKELSKTQKAPAELAEVLGELFSVRSTEVLGALRALETTLQANAKVEPDIRKLNKTFQNITETTGVLADRITQTNKQMGEAFVTGLVGGKDFNETLKKINNIQLSLIRNMGKYGEVTKDAFIVAGIASVIAFRAEVVKLLVLLKSPITLGAVAAFTVLNFKAEANRLEQEAKDLAGKFNAVGSEIATQINKGFKGQLSVKELNDLLLQLETFGGKQLGIDPGTFARIIEILKQRLVLENQIETKTKQQDINLSHQIIIRDQSIASILEELKNQGALNSTILETEKLLKQRNQVGESFEDSLKRQLEIERERRKEQQLQTKLSSTATKLFEIAQTGGVEIAKQIGDVLSKKVDFSTFVRRGGEAVEVFKKEFESIFKEQQALAFFKGESVPGAEGLRRGTSITLPVEDMALIEPLSKIIDNEQRQVELTAYRVELEEKISQLRQVELAKTRTKNLASGTIETGTPSIPIAPIRFEALGNSISLVNARLQELFRTQAIIPAARGANTPSEINRAIQTAEASYNINFNEGAFNIFGSPDKATQTAMKKAVTDGIKEFQDKLIGKQSPNL